MKIASCGHFRYTAFMVSLFAHRSLLWQLIKRDIAIHYRGTALGFAWSLLNPLLMLAIYTFVFSVVFKARWPLPDDQPQGQFAVILFTGLILHALAAAALMAAPRVILNQVNYVKKVVFPLEILPLVTIGTALFHFCFSLIILLIAALLIMGNIPATALWLPLILIPYLFGIIGAVWILASLGVFLRDIGQIIGLIVMILLFLSPIFYPAEALPPDWRGWLNLNPLTLIISQARDVLLWGVPPNFKALGIYALCSFAFMWLGYRWFQKTRKGFADVL